MVGVLTIFIISDENVSDQQLNCCTNIQYMYLFQQSVQEIFQTLIREIENHNQDGNVDKKDDCNIL